MKYSNIHQLKEVATSHDESIKKKVFLEKGDIPNLMMFNSVVFKPGQKVETHKHDSMTEVFYVQSGKAEFVVNNEKTIVKPGDCISIEAGEAHSQYNPFNEDVTFLYFGIATQ